MGRLGRTLLLAGLLSLLSSTQAKVFKRCELVGELRRLGAKEKNLGDWMCLAYHESRYNSAAEGRLNWDRSVDHGLFQISDIYWCDWSTNEPNRQYKNVCNKNCNSFHDDDISDDFRCVMKIYKEHQRLQGNGFKAWTAWKQHCQHADLSKYTRGCGSVAITQRPTSRPPAARPVRPFYQDPAWTNAHTHFNNLAPLANRISRERAGARPQHGSYGTQHGSHGTRPRAWSRYNHNVFLNGL